MYIICEGDSKVVSSIPFFHALCDIFLIVPRVSQIPKKLQVRDFVEYRQTLTRVMVLRTDRRGDQSVPLWQNYAVTP